MRIGIVDYHKYFTSVIKNIIPDHHTVIVYDMKETVDVNDIDLLINHWAPEFNDKYKIPHIVVPHCNFTQEHVNYWNRNKWCRGVLDITGLYKKRFPSIEKPIWKFDHNYTDLPVFTESGNLIISLIHFYESYWKEDYKFAKTITSNLYGAPSNMVDDIEKLKEARWLLHIKPTGVLCNAVIRALACGVPVIMDTQTFNNGWYEKVIRHGHNAIVLPRNQLQKYLKTEEGYDQIKKTCIQEATLYKIIRKWDDGWWL